MKKLLYLLWIFILSIGFVGCRGREDQTNSVYTDEELGIELKLPTSWPSNTEIQSTEYDDGSGGKIDVYLKTENSNFKPLLLQVLAVDDNKWNEIKDNVKELKEENGLHYAYYKPDLDDVLNSKDGTKEEKELYENHYISEDDSIENIITFIE